MAKLTSKYHITIPKGIAKKYNIRPGDEIAWLEAGEAIRVIPAREDALGDDRKFRLRLFDQVTARIQKKRSVGPHRQSPERGWKREDLWARPISLITGFGRVQ